MPPAASAAVAIRNSRSARARAGGRVLGEQHGRGRLEGDDADPPGQVQVQLAGHLQARGSRFGQEHRQAGLGHRRDHDDARRVGRDDVPPAAGQPPAAGPVVGPDAAGARGPVAGLVGGRHRPGHRPGGQLRKPPLAGLAVTGGQQRPGRHRAGQERAGVQGPAEFDVDRARLDLGLAEPAELLRDRPARQAQLARQPGVQLGMVAGLAVQRAAQLGRGQLAGEDGAQGVMLGVLVFAEVDRVPNRHESRSSVRPAVPCSQTRQLAFRANARTPAGISRVVADAPRSVRHKFEDGPGHGGSGGD